MENLVSLTCLPCNSSGLCSHNDFQPLHCEFNPGCYIVSSECDSSVILGDEEKELFGFLCQEFYVANGDDHAF